MRGKNQTAYDALRIFLKQKINDFMLKEGIIKPTTVSVKKQEKESFNRTLKTVNEVFKTSGFSGTGGGKTKKAFSVNDIQTIFYPCYRVAKRKLVKLPRKYLERPFESV